MGAAPIVALRQELRTDTDDLAQQVVLRQGWQAADLEPRPSCPRERSGRSGRINIFRADRYE